MPKPIHNATIGIDAAIAQERPIAPRLFLQLWIDFRDQNLFLVARGFFQEFAEGIGDEAATKKLDAVAGGAVDFFEADAIGTGDVDAVGDGVRALNRFPGGALRFTKGGFFLRMPA